MAQSQEFGHRRAEKGVGYATVFRIATLNPCHPSGMRIILGAQAPHQGQVVHLLSAPRQKFTDANTGNTRRNRPEGAAERGVRLGIPTFELANTPIEPDEQHLSMLLGFLRCRLRCVSRDRGRSYRGGQCGSTDLPKPLPTRPGMLARYAQR